MISTTFTERGALNVVRTLEGIRDRSRDGSPAWRKIHDYLQQISKVQFEGGGRRGPNKWANLHPTTIKRKRDAGFRTKKMYRTEDLVSSIVNASHPNHVWRTDSESAVFGSSLEQHAVQQRGYDGAPFRPPLDPTERDVRNMTKIVNDMVMSAKRGANVVL